VQITFNAQYDYLRPNLPLDALRLGSHGDGGYVVSRSAVNAANLLLSFGLGDNFSFERDFQQCNANAKVWNYDHTIPALDFKYHLKALFSAIYALQPGHFRQKFNFAREYKKFFGSLGLNRQFRNRVTHVAYKPVDIGIGTILDESKFASHIFFKVDIEGDEFKILEALLPLKEKVVGLVVEFHNAGTHYSEFRELVTRFQEFMFIDHFHVNNYDGVATNGFPEVLEISFSSKALPVKRSVVSKLPNVQFDYPNTLKYQDYEIDWVS